MPSIINATTTNGLVTSADNSGEIQLQSNGTTGLTMNTNEGIQILNCLGVGNATPSTSGAGITFPATKSPSSDANTLDDYEEGTWTPSYLGSVSNPTVTYSFREGRYVKIGQFVWVFFEISASSFSGGSGTLRIGGLPFTSSGNGGFSASYAQAFNTFAPIAGIVNAVTAINLTMRDSNTTISYIPVGYANGSAYLLGFANYTVA